MAGIGRRTHYRKYLTDSVLNDLPVPEDDERIAKVVATRGGNQFEIILANFFSKNDNGDDDDNSNGAIGSVIRTPQLAILPTKFHKLIWVKRNDYVIVQTGIIDASKKKNSKLGSTDNNDDSSSSNSNSNIYKDEKKNTIMQKEGNNDMKKKKYDADDVLMVATKETGIRFIISHILYKDQIHNLKAKQLWPEDDAEFFEGGVIMDSTKTRNNDEHTMTKENDANTNDDNININYDNRNSNNTDAGTNITEEDNDHGIVYNEYNGENDHDLFVNTNRIARLEIDDDSDADYSSSDEEDS